jgi:hypothetical protein
MANMKKFGIGLTTFALTSAAGTIWGTRAVAYGPRARKGKRVPA